MSLFSSFHAFIRGIFCLITSHGLKKLVHTSYLPQFGGCELKSWHPSLPAQLDSNIPNFLFIPEDLEAGLSDVNARRDISGLIR